jgi:hypothetical protein
VAADGGSLVLVLDRPRMTREAVMRRRLAEVREDHFERFAREEATFRARNGLAAFRPRADAPAPWLDVPLSEAKAAAARGKKPLLAFLFTETSTASFLYDYYTLPDREVDELLRRFVLVRIDAEKDPEKSYAAVGARALPCLVPFTAEGGPVEFRFCMRDETGETFDFAENERMVTGWQGPVEFAENLRRILKAAR